MRLLVLTVLAALVVTASAAATPFYSIKKAGLWYWSLNLGQSVFPPPTMLEAQRHQSSTSLVSGLGLNRDEKRSLEERISGLYYGVYSSPHYERSPAFDDGTVVFKAQCRGRAPAATSPSVNIDLYHRFGCVLSTATYKRLTTFKTAVQQARVAVIAAADPKPQATLDALVNAYASLGHYCYVGDPRILRVTITAVGRSTYTITRP